MLSVDTGIRCIECGSYLEMGELRRVYCPTCQPGTTTYRMKHDDSPCHEVLRVVWHPKGYSTYCTACDCTPDMQSLSLEKRAVG